MNKNVIGLVVLAFAMFSPAFAAKKGKAPKMVAGRPMVIDYQGQATGSEIPAWVQAITDGSQKKVRKALDIGAGDAIFILSNKGNDLDFLKTWTDQVDVRAEVASSIEQIVGQTVVSELEAKEASTQTKERVAKLYSSTMTNLTLNGLTKEAYYWIQTRTMKPGVKKIKSEADYTDEYTYYVVYSIKQSVYNLQLKKALDDVEDNDDQTVFLKSVLTEKLTQTILMPEATNVDFGDSDLEILED